MTTDTFVYRVTQYDPRDRDADGAYTGQLGWLSDEGPVEAAYLEAVRGFLDECAVVEVTVRDPEWSGADPDRRPLAADHPLARVLGTRAERWVDGATLTADEAVEVVRWMLRNHLWCRLEGSRGVAVHVGWDLYVYVTVDRPCVVSVAAAERLGLFPERLERSPYERGADELDPDPRVVDDSFWADVDALAERRGAVTVVEIAAWNRRWTMTAGGVHPAIRPGARVAVWPRARGRGERRPAVASAVLRLAARWTGGRSLDRWAPDVRVARGLVWHGKAWVDRLDDDPPAVLGVVPDPRGELTARWCAWD